MVKVKQYSTNSIFLSALLIIFLVFTGLVKIKNRAPYSSLISKDKVFFVYGEISSSPVKTSNEKFYSSSLNLLKVKSKDNCESSASGKIKVYIPSNLIEAYYPGKLYTAAKNQAYCWETGGRYYLKGKFVKDNFYVESCDYGYFPNTFYGKIQKLRCLFRLQFRRMMYGWGKAGGLLLALLSGSREYTEGNLTSSFKNAGLSHILALSGMHLSLFSGIIIFFGNKIKRKKLTIIFRFITVTLFVWFAGFSPSLLRAFLCSLLTLIAIVANTEDVDSLLILAFSFLLQIIISPSDIYNVGFILSYSALAGILIFNKMFLIFYSSIFPFLMSASLASSTSAQIFTIPVSLKTFGSFSPIGIIATFFISPLVTLFIYSGLFFIILSLLIPSLTSYSGIFMNLQYTVIKFTVSFFAAVPQIKIN